MPAQKQGRDVEARYVSIRTRLDYPRRGGSDSYRAAVEALDSLTAELEREPLSICAHCGAAFEWDHKGDSCPGCDRAEQAEVREERLVALVRIGFLVTVNGERATADLVADPDTRALLFTILGAADTERAVAALAATEKSGEGEAQDYNSLREGLAQVRLRHMYNHHQAGESLSVWLLNGNNYRDWVLDAGLTRPSDFGYEDEIAYQKHMDLNRQLRTIANEAYEG